MFQIRDAKLFLAGVIYLLVTAVLAGSIVKNLSFDAEITEILAGDTQARETLAAFEHQYPELANSALLAVQLDGSREMLEALADAKIELLLAEGVRTATSFFTFLEAVPFEHAPQQGAQPETLEESIDRLRSDFLLSRQFISEDRTLALITVNWRADVLPAQKDLAISQFGAALPAGMTWLEVSEAAINSASAAAIQSDQIQVLVVSTLACTVLAYLLLGSVRATVVMVLPALVGVLWSLGILGLVGIAINPLLMVVPTLLLVLGAADNLHYVYAIRRHRLEAPVERAVLKGITETGPAAFVTSLTTVIAFLSMWILGDATLRDLAFFGTIGLALQFIAVTTGVAILYAWIDPPTAVIRQFTWVEKLAGHILRHHPVAPGLAVLAIAALAGPQALLTSAHDPLEHVPRSSGYPALLSEIDAKLDGAGRLFVIVDAADRTPGVQDADLDQVTRALTAIGEGPALTEALAETLPNALAGLEALDGSGFALSFPVPYAAMSTTLLEIREELTLALQKAGLAGDTQITGAPLIVAAEIPPLVDDMNMSFYVAIGMVGLLALMLTRSVRATAVFLAPNVATVLVFGAVLVLLSQPLSMTLAITMTIAFGVALDDTIHLANHVWRAGRKSPTTEEVVMDAVSKVASPLFATTALLTVGFLSVSFSTIPALQEFGLLMATATLFAFLFDMLVFPSLAVTDKLPR